MAIKYLAGERIIGTAAERAALSGNTLGSVAQTSWKLLVKKTHSSDTRFFDTGTFAAKKFLWVQVHVICGISGGVEPRITVNGSGITGNTYSTKYNNNYL